MALSLQKLQPGSSSFAHTYDLLTENPKEVECSTEKTTELNCSKKSETNKKKWNLCVNIATEILLDIFGNLTRNELDIMQLVSKRFNALVKKEFVEGPIRVMYAVLLQEQLKMDLNDENRMRHNSVVIYYNKGAKEKRRFDCVEDMLELKQQQKVHFANVFIATNSASINIKEKLHLSIIRDDPAKICNFFKYNEPIPAVVPEIQPYILPNSSVYSRRPNFQMYHARSFDCEWSYSVQPNDFVSVETFIQWLEFNNSYCGAKPKRFRANIRGFTILPNIFLSILFERFEQQNKPCPFEIIVMDFSEQLHLVQEFCNKSVKNYVTNEVLESIAFVDSNGDRTLVREEDLLNSDYRNVDWVLRRRSLNTSWEPWWTVATEEVDKKFGKKQDYFSMESGHLMFRIRYSTC